MGGVAGAEIAIVCGKNQSLYHKAEELRQRSDVSVKVYNHIDFVHKLISVADVVISKGGASTCMEILMLKKIPIVTDFIWEQEKGNVEFLTQNKIGFYEPHMNRLPGLVNRVLTDESLQREYASNLEGLRLRSGTDTVAKWVVEVEHEALFTSG
jgi:processive 1,2-diacylglycerol beta-glucosyltransferase/1,2-diacylglycerol 3-beta-galactosyltransferase